MYEVNVDRRKPFSDMYDFLFEKYGACHDGYFYDFKNSDKEWTYWYACGFVFKSEIDAIEFKLMFG